MRYKERQVRLYFSPHRRYEYLEAEGLLYVIRLKANGTLPICFATCRSPARPCSPFPRQLQLSGRIVEQEAPCRGQSGVAPRRFLASVSSSLICRALPSGCRRSIIRARRSSTSRKARTPSTGPVCHVQVPTMRSAPASRPGLQSGQLHEALALPKRWSTGHDDRDKLVKIGAKVVRHGRRYVPIG